MPAAPPTGALALVFTDIQGSTALWEADLPAMRDALALHDSLLRDLLERHGGYEVKAEGDAFFLAFQSVAPALAWCRDVQRSLPELPWPAGLRVRAPQGLAVRIGVHVGRPERRDNPVTGRADYFGPVVNRAARISSAAHGGQVVASAAAVAGVAVEGLLAVPHGAHALRGLDAPVDLVELRLVERGERAFPPLRTAGRPGARVDRPRTLHPDDLRRALGDVARTLVPRGQVRMLRGRLDDGAADLDAALACARLLDDPALVAQAEHQLGALAYRRGRPGPALAHFERAVTAARAAGAAPAEVAALSSMASMELLQGAVDRARARVEEALALARAGDLPAAEAASLNTLGLLCKLQDQPAAAAAAYRQAAAAFRRAGMVRGEAAAASNLCDAASAVEDPETDALLDRAEALAQEAEDARLVHIVRANRGAWALDRGRPGWRPLLQAAWADLQTVGDAANAGQAAVFLALGLLSTGERSEARAVVAAASGVDAGPAVGARLAALGHLFGAGPLPIDPPDAESRAFVELAGRLAAGRPPGPLGVASLELRVLRRLAPADGQESAQGATQESGQGPSGCVSRTHAPSS